MSRVQCAGITQKQVRCNRRVRLVSGQSVAYCMTHTMQGQQQQQVDHKQYVENKVASDKHQKPRSIPQQGTRPFFHPNLTEQMWRELLSHDSVHELYNNKEKWQLFNPNSFDFWGSVSGLDAEAHGIVRTMYEKMHIID